MDLLKIQTCSAHFQQSRLEMAQLFEHNSCALFKHFTQAFEPASCTDWS
jgi:hypothetical protein